MTVEARPLRVAKEAGSSRSQAKPSLARAEIVDKSIRQRFETELDASLKRKGSHEEKLGGALRAIAAFSPALRSSLAEVAQVMIRRSSFGRELYSASIRSLAEAGDKRVASLIASALVKEECGGPSTLSAACFSDDKALAPLLGKIAASGKSHLAFRAEVARIARGESNGALLTSLSPMIKESHRIALCVELFVPLLRRAPLSDRIGPALEVLRSAERHLGRWLLLAEVATRAGDPRPLAEAIAKQKEGPLSARAAWSLVAWALEQAAPKNAESAPLRHPETRPTVELVARLSDRPSADRDTTFLFRMARAGAPSARPMLEMAAKGPLLSDEVSVRAALYLARDHARTDMSKALLDCATSSKKDELRGLATAALWDAGEKVRAREIADDLIVSKSIGNAAWGTLVRAAAARGSDEDIAHETNVRWIQWGWLE